MTYVFASLIVAWLCVLLFLAGLCMNDMRLVLNNLAPGATGSQPPPAGMLDKVVGIAPFAIPHPAVFLAALLLQIAHLTRLDRLKSTLFSSINPAELNEAGRSYLKAGIKHERMLIVWVVGGFILLIVTVSHFQTS